MVCRKWGGVPVEVIRFFCSSASLTPMPGLQAFVNQPRRAMRASESRIGGLLPGDTAIWTGISSDGTTGTGDLADVCCPP